MKMDIMTLWFKILVSCLPAAVISELPAAPDVGSDFARTSVTFQAGPCPVATQPSFVLAFRN